MSVVYKTLFRIIILHEYYLTASDGKKVFEELTQQGRIQFLLDEFSKGHSSINSDLDFEFPEALQAEYQNYGLKILPAYSGCKVLVRVRQITLPDGSIVYEPFNALPAGRPIYLVIDKRNNSIDGYSNRPVHSPVPCIQYFTNSNPGNGKVFPNLSARVADFDGGKIYEQGELASFGANDLRQFIPGNPNPQWEPVNGSYASASDNILAPLRFQYSIRNSSPVTAAEWQVLDPEGQEICRRTVGYIPAEQKVTLDFRAESGPIMNTDTGGVASGECMLKARGNNGYAFEQKIIFSDRLYASSRWAVVEMLPVPGDLRYSLLDGSGRLHQSRDPNGLVTDAPVFEIPVKSRYSFWRFINNRGRELKLVPALQDYLFKEDGMLITRKPVALTKNYFLVPGQGSAIKKYLPNPAVHNLKRDPKNRICLDVIVPQSDLFQIVI